MEVYDMIDGQEIRDPIVSSLPSLPPRVRGDVQGCAMVSIGGISWIPSPSFSEPIQASVRLLWWGEHGRGLWLNEGQEASYIIRCTYSDMKAYLTDMRVLVLDIFDRKNDAPVAESVVDFASAHALENIDVVLPVISRASAVVGHLPFKFVLSFETNISANQTVLEPRTNVQVSEKYKHLPSSSVTKQPIPSGAPSIISKRPKKKIKDSKVRSPAILVCENDVIGQLLSKGRRLRDCMEAASTSGFSFLKPSESGNLNMELSALNEVSDLSLVDSEADPEQLFAKLFFERTGSDVIVASKERKLNEKVAVEAPKHEAENVQQENIAPEGAIQIPITVAISSIDFERGAFPKYNCESIKVLTKLPDSADECVVPATRMVKDKSKSTLPVNYNAKLVLPKSSDMQSTPVEIIVEFQKRRFGSLPFNVCPYRGIGNIPSGHTDRFVPFSISLKDESGQRRATVELQLLRGDIPCPSSPSDRTQASTISAMVSADTKLLKHQDQSKDQFLKASRPQTPSSPMGTVGEVPAVSEPVAVLPGDLVVIQIGILHAVIDEPVQDRFQNTFVSYQIFGDHDRVRTPLRSEKYCVQFHHLDHVPRLFSNKLYGLFKDAHLILEVWSTSLSRLPSYSRYFQTATILLGIAKIPLRCLLQCFHCGFYDKHGEENVDQVLSLFRHHEAIIRNVLTGKTVGAITISLALGSSSQMAFLAQLWRSAIPIQRIVRGHLSRLHSRVRSKKDSLDATACDQGDGNKKLIESALDRKASKRPMCSLSHKFCLRIASISGIRLAPSWYGECNMEEAVLWVSYRFPGETRSTCSIKRALTVGELSADATFDSEADHIVQIQPSQSIQRYILSCKSDVIFEVWLANASGHDAGIVAGRTLLPLQILLSATASSKPSTALSLFVRPFQPFLPPTPALPPCELHISFSYEPVDDYQLPSLSAQSSPGQDLIIIVDIDCIKGLDACFAFLSQRYHGLRGTEVRGFNVSVEITLFNETENVFDDWTRSTAVVPQTFEPEFHHQDNFQISADDQLLRMLRSESMILKVYHHFFSSSKLGTICIGTVAVPLSGLLDDKDGISGWFPIFQDDSLLADFPAGVVLLSVRFGSDGFSCVQALSAKNVTYLSGNQEDDHQSEQATSRSPGTVRSEETRSDEGCAPSGSFTLFIDRLLGLRQDGAFSTKAMFSHQVHKSSFQSPEHFRYSASFSCRDCNKSVFGGQTFPLFSVKVEVWSKGDATLESLVGTAVIDVSPLVIGGKTEIWDNLYELAQRSADYANPVYIRARILSNILDDGISQHAFPDPFQTPAKVHNQISPPRVSGRIDPILFETPEHPASPFVPLQKLDNACKLVEIQPNETGSLSIQVIQAANIQAPEAMTGFLYVTFSLDPAPLLSWQSGQSSTPLEPGSSHPYWSHHITLKAEVLPAVEDFVNMQFVFCLCHRPSYSDDNVGVVIGRTAVSLRSFADPQGSGRGSGWFDILNSDNKTIGNILLEIVPDDLLSDAMRSVAVDAVDMEAKPSQINTTTQPAEDEIFDNPILCPEVSASVSINDLRQRLSELDILKTRLSQFSSKPQHNETGVPSTVATPKRRRVLTTFTAAPSTRNSPLHVKLTIDIPSKDVSPSRLIPSLSPALLFDTPSPKKVDPSDAYIRSNFIEKLHNFAGFDGACSLPIDLHSTEPVNDAPRFTGHSPTDDSTIAAVHFQGDDTSQMVEKSSDVVIDCGQGRKSAVDISHQEKSFPVDSFSGSHVFNTVSDESLVGDRFHDVNGAVEDAGNLIDRMGSIVSNSPKKSDDRITSPSTARAFIDSVSQTSEEHIAPSNPNAFDAVKVDGPNTTVRINVVVDGVPASTDDTANPDPSPVIDRVVDREDLPSINREHNPRVADRQPISETLSSSPQPNATDLRCLPVSSSCGDNRGFHLPPDAPHSLSDHAVSKAFVRCPEISSENALPSPIGQHAEAESVVMDTAECKGRNAVEFRDSATSPVAFPSSSQPKFNLATWSNFNKPAELFCKDSQNSYSAENDELNRHPIEIRSNTALDSRGLPPRFPKTRRNFADYGLTLAHRDRQRSERIARIFAGEAN
uniref:C2 domain-containing protein n=1 Tax=Spongospora subterranea TaxID=70186 RepID=A0A0H5QXB3_9EUKA|eukprot:CRZ06256.1 hypothetical protein [Spongospora subterranea]